MFDNNFGKCGPIFKVLSPINWFLRKFSLLRLQKFPFHLLTYNMLLHYLVKVENRKMLPNFHVEPDN